MLGVLLVSALAVASVLLFLPSFIGSLFSRDCQTTLCCQACRTIAVSRVIDGDTFDSPMGRIRLYGVDTPELGRQCYREATVLLSKLAGSTARVEAGPRVHDRNGRLLYYLYTQNGDSVAERLIVAGLGRAWTGDGQHRDFLVGLEQQTRHLGDGCLW